ncbi:MAG: hypothetical protein ACUZ8A_06575 [Candidatus Bathyanammoxibius sp.]
MNCGIARVAGKKMTCDTSECSQWDSDKNQCTVKSFLDTYSLLQVIAMELKRDMEKMTAESEEDD